jgi:hypothetical protein
MDATKPLVSSKTFWASLVPIGVGLGTIYVSLGTPALPAVLSTQIPVIISACVAIIGRIQATKRIG